MMDSPFLVLLRCALWGGRPDLRLSEADWLELWSQACRQGVWALLYDVVRNLPPEAGLPEILAAKWAEGAAEVESRNAAMASLVSVQKGIFDRHGIEAVQLKGLSLAHWYPVPQHRLCGDVDWWFPRTGDWEKALALVKDAGAKVSADSDGDVHYRANGIVVEHHRKGYDMPGIEGELLLLVGHIFHHAAVTGVGVRQLCDLALAYSGCRGEFDSEKFTSVLKDKGLLGFSELLHAVLRDCLGLDPSALPSVRREPRRRDVERFICLVLSDGSFGLDKERRTSGFFRRFFLLGRYAPKAFALRWLSLFKGRMLRRV